tara:strand:- start:3359 stop:3904 length:546 start_codon:yes stop_codon:yes gene_type:complete
LFTITNHILDQAEFIESPNFSKRPKGLEPDLLVIHNISLPPGEFGGSYIIDFFQNRLNHSLHPFFKEISDLRVSSHLFISRDGKVIQFVGFQKKAWHAGLSEYKGRKECNDFSIGIELEGTDKEVYTNEQYSTLIEVTNCLIISYPRISKDRIVGHSDIAPQRKTDPGESFDWAKYINSLN